MKGVCNSHQLLYRTGQLRCALRNEFAVRNAHAVGWLAINTASVSTIANDSSLAIFEVLEVSSSRVLV